MVCQVKALSGFKKVKVKKFKSPSVFLSNLNEPSLSLIIFSFNLTKKLLQLPALVLNIGMIGLRGDDSSYRMND